MIKIRLEIIAVLLVCAGLFPACAVFSGSSSGQSLNDIKRRLPRQFTGTFIWENDEDIQRVIINIYDVKSAQGIITATGKGTYNAAGVITIIDVKISINTSTGFFEMWESNPDRDNGFITEGSHTGAISPDLRMVQAVWTTSGSGSRGRLELTAADPGR